MPQMMTDRRRMIGALALLGGVSAGSFAWGRWASLSGRGTLRHLKLIAPGAPGGGYDETARSCEKALIAAGLIEAAQVTNLPGAGGTIGLVRFVEQFRRKSNAILVTGSTMLSAMLVNRTPIDLTAATPLARLTGSGHALVVPATSPWKSLAELVAAFQRDPGAIAWAGGSIGGGDHIIAGLFAKAAGVDPRRLNYVAYAGGGEIVAALLGSHVAMASSSTAELAEYIRSGQLRSLGVTSALAEAGIAAQPLRAQGMDLTFYTWRAVMAAPGIATDAGDCLRQIFERMARSDAWAVERNRLGWKDLYLAGDAFTKFLDDERRRTRAILTELGLLNRR